MGKGNDNTAEIQLIERFKEYISKSSKTAKLKNIFTGNRDIFGDAKRLNIAINTATTCFLIYYKNFIKIPCDGLLGNQEYYAFEISDYSTRVVKKITIDQRILWRINLDQVFSEIKNKYCKYADNPDASNGIIIQRDVRNGRFSDNELSNDRFSSLFNKDIFSFICEILKDNSFLVGALKCGGNINRIFSLLEDEGIQNDRANYRKAFDKYVNTVRAGDQQLKSVLKKNEDIAKLNLALETLSAHLFCNENAVFKQAKLTDIKSRDANIIVTSLKNKKQIAYSLAEIKKVDEKKFKRALNSINQRIKSGVTCIRPHEKERFENKRSSPKYCYEEIQLKYLHVAILLCYDIDFFITAVMHHMSAWDSFNKLNREYERSHESNTVDKIIDWSKGLWPSKSNSKSKVDISDDKVERETVSQSSDIGVTEDIVGLPGPSVEIYVDEIPKMLRTPAEQRYLTIKLKSHILHEDKKVKKVNLFHFMQFLVIYYASQGNKHISIKMNGHALEEIMITDGHKREDFDFFFLFEPKTGGIANISESLSIVIKRILSDSEIFDVVCRREYDGRRSEINGYRIEKLNDLRIVLSESAKHAFSVFEVSDTKVKTDQRIKKLLENDYVEKFKVLMKPILGIQ